MAEDKPRPTHSASLSRKAKRFGRGVHPAGENSQVLPLALKSSFVPGFYPGVIIFVRGGWNLRFHHPLHFTVQESQNNGLGHAQR